MMKKMALAAMAVALALPAGAQAQMGSGIGIGVAPHVGTMGIGADVGVSLNRMFTVRLSGNFVPVTISRTFSDIDYDLEARSPIFGGIVDFFPTGAGLRLSVGYMSFGSDFEIEGTPTGTVDIGGESYDAEQVGTLVGTLNNDDAGPYLGLGYGNAGKKGFGFFMDLGVILQGTPTVLLEAPNRDFGNAQANAEFDDRLADEAADLEDDADVLKFYPVISLGLTLPIGR